MSFIGTKSEISLWISRVVSCHFSIVIDGWRGLAISNAIYVWRRCVWRHSHESRSSTCRVMRHTDTAIVSTEAWVQVGSSLERKSVWLTIVLQNISVNLHDLLGKRWRVGIGSWVLLRRLLMRSCLHYNEKLESLHLSTHKLPYRYPLLIGFLIELKIAACCAKFWL